MSLRSMTGFGRAEFEVGGEVFTVEMRSVNHRHSDLSLRLPRQLSFLEPVLRGQLRQRFARGKLDVSVGQRTSSGGAGRVQVDPAAAAQYLGAGEALRRSHAVPGDLDLATLLTLPGVASFVEPDLEEEKVTEAASLAVEEAASRLEAMRVAEGESLERDLRSRLGLVARFASGLEERSGAVRETARERLKTRMQQLAEETGLDDQARLYHEIALAVDRLDVTEELVRLASHVDQFEKLVAAGEPVGRRLDFLLQEMVREVNTIGSKGSDATLAHTVVELKGELERIREQVQNVE